MASTKPTPAQKRAILAAIDNGGRTSSDPYQLRTITALLRSGWMTEPDGRTLEVTDEGRKAAAGRRATSAQASAARTPTTAEAHALVTAITDAEQHGRDYADFFCTKARADMIARMKVAGWVDGEGRSARVTPAGREAVGHPVAEVSASEDVTLVHFALFGNGIHMCGVHKPGDTRTCEEVQVTCLHCKDLLAAQGQRHRWTTAVMASKNAGLTIREAEQAVRDAAHAEALATSAKRDAGFTHLTRTGVPHLSVCGEWAVDVPITVLARKATCSLCVPGIETKAGRG